MSVVRQIATSYYGDDLPDIWQVDHDSNGNARYVVSYLAIPAVEDNSKDAFQRQRAEFERAKKMLNGKTYRAKWFGGGIVFQAYAGDPIAHVQAAISRAKDEMLNGEHSEDFLYHYGRVMAIRSHPAGKGI